MHSKSLFIRFASLEGNISCILNSVCINIYYMSKKWFLLQILFFALSNNAKKFSDFTSSTLIARRASILKKIFPLGNNKLYLPQKLLKIASDMLYKYLSEYSTYLEMCLDVKVLKNKQHMPQTVGRAQYGLGMNNLHKLKEVISTRTVQEGFL